MYHTVVVRRRGGEWRGIKGLKPLTVVDNVSRFESNTTHYETGNENYHSDRALHTAVSAAPSRV